MAEPTKAEMDALDALLNETAQRPDPVLGDDLMSRILADAAAAQVASERSDKVDQTGGWRGWVETLGGWPVLGGMAMAGVTGLWLGVSPPAAIDALVADMIGDTVSMDFLGLTDPFEMEG